MDPVVRRLLDQPIIHPGLDPSLGDNINGPSLIRAPDWLPRRQAQYYLYFAHHMGGHIRVAFADALGGPWQIHVPGAVHLAETPFAQSRPDLPQPAWAAARGIDGLYPHIASPDVHVDEHARELIMALHGLDEDGEQRTVIARSVDGLHWEVGQARSNQSYLRLFQHRGATYAMARGGQIMAWTGEVFEPGPWAFPEPHFPPGHRHAGLLLRGDLCHVFWSRIGDRPERIWHSTIDLSGDWQHWRAEGMREVLAPEADWEGADLPLTVSQVGAALERERGLRDPVLYEEGGWVFMIYAGAGEHALGLAEVTGI